MGRTKGWAGPLAAVGVAALAGCFSLGRDTPPLQQYVLGGVRTPQSVASPQGTADLTIGMRQVDLAAYLTTPAIVVRRGDHRIVHSEFHRWGEDPEIGINRTVAGYLAAAERVRAADVVPWPVRSRYDYLIQLHVTRFEGVAPADSAATAGEAHVQATWEIVRQQDEAVLARGATDFRESGWRVGDYGGLVTMLDSGLQALSREIVTCLARLASSASAADDVELAPDRGTALTCAQPSD